MKERMRDCQGLMNSTNIEINSGDPPLSEYPGSRKIQLYIHAFLLQGVFIEKAKIVLKYTQMEKVIFFARRILRKKMNNNLILKHSN
jgi:hypothetical protein